MAAYQYPLQIKLDDAATFENYVVGQNADVVAIIKANTEAYLYLWSVEATGKTHLLQAMCHARGQGQAIYLPLQELSALQPEVLEGLEQFPLVCLDDIQHIAGRKEWEVGLFALYNNLREQGGHLCVTGNLPPNQLKLHLNDLLSRLNWGPVFQLLPLNDAQKIAALQLRATQRGFQLPDEVANYLLNHNARDLHNLFTILDRLDAASLQAQRRLTIPFVKQWL
jgi:DnaA family protein